MACGGLDTGAKRRCAMSEWSAYKVLAGVTGERGGILNLTLLEEDSGRG